MADQSGCFYCHTTEKELRPYGPGGSPLCFACLKASPEREEAAGNVFGAQLQAAAAIGDDVVVLTEEGPQPYRRRS